MELRRNRHFHRQNSFDFVFVNGLQLFFRERNQCDGSKESHFDALLSQMANGCFCHTRACAPGNNQIFRIFHHIFFVANFVFFPTFIYFFIFGIVIFQVVVLCRHGSEIRRVHDQMLFAAVFSLSGHIGLIRQIGCFFIVRHFHLLHHLTHHAVCHNNHGCAIFFGQIPGFIHYIDRFLNRLRSINQTCQSTVSKGFGHHIKVTLITGNGTNARAGSLNVYNDCRQARSRHNTQCFRHQRQPRARGCRHGSRPCHSRARNHVYR